MSDDQEYKQSIKDEFADEPRVVEDEGEDDVEALCEKVVSAVTITAVSAPSSGRDDSRGASSSREWKESIARGEEGEIVKPSNPRAARIMSGFKM